jgi:hypothetical protein
MDTFEDKSCHKCSTWLSSYDELASYLLSPELINFLLLLQYAVMSTLRAGPPVVLSRWPCKGKLDEEKLKHGGLAQQNCFGRAFLHRMLSNTCC